MKNKKFVIDLLFILLALFLFIFWYENKEKHSSQITSLQGQKLNIYLITMDKVNQYWYYINDGAKDMADFWDITYIWDAPQQRSIERQIEIVNQAAQNNADAILLTAIDARRLAEPVANAKAKGVKIVYVDSPANEEAITTLATDNYDAGKIAGETMIEELGALGIQKGTIGIVGINTSTDNTMRREAGFRQAIVEDRRFTVLGTEYANSDLVQSQEAAARMISENTDLVGIFGTDEISSVGVGNAIKAVNNKVVGIGFDQSDATLKLMDGGSLKAIVVQNPYTMGYLGMAQAIAALKGFDTGPKYINTGVKVLRKR